MPWNVQGVETILIWDMTQNLIAIKRPHLTEVSGFSWIDFHVFQNCTQFIEMSSKQIGVELKQTSHRQTLCSQGSAQALTGCQEFLRQFRSIEESLSHFLMCLLLGSI